MSEHSARALARAIEQRGLGAPARILVDAHRPLGPLIGDLAVAVEPLARRLGLGWTDDIVTTAVDPTGLDRLLDAIDDEASVRRAEPG